MDNKSTVNANITRLLIGIVIPMSASAECVLHDLSVSRNTVVISERTSIRKDIVPAISGHKKCMVNFRVRIGASWHSAFGEYTWPGDRPEEHACAIAVDRAESDAKYRVGKSQIFSERTLICNDRPELRELSQSMVGTVGDLGQFRPHPDHTQRFYHNGTVCRWFTEPQFTGQGIYNFQGVICEINSGKWVVVDKF